ncbi:MAG: hypothetical protein HPY58_00195 [Firmicutes bacterium]|nr:hypothetical protein [Bacillota bacterium]
MLIHEMRSGEKVFLRDDTIIVRFPGPRRVVSTARINGGHREDLQAVFNHHIPADCKAGELPGGSAEGYLFPGLSPAAGKRTRQPPCSGPSFPA